MYYRSQFGPKNGAEERSGNTLYLFSGCARFESRSGYTCRDQHFLEFTQSVQTSNAFKPGTTLDALPKLMTIFPLHCTLR